jgi:hypothetical protein
MYETEVLNCTKGNANTIFMHNQIYFIRNLEMYYTFIMTKFRF